MKKTIRILSFTLSLLLAFSVVIIPSHAEDGIQHTENDLHELVSYTDAVSAGHVNRLTDEEDMNTIVFANSDNTKTMYYYAEDIKYTDSDGSVHDKTNNLTYKNGVYFTRDNDIVSELPRDISSGVIVSHDDIMIRMTPVSLHYEKMKEYTSRAQYSAMPRGEADSVMYGSVFGENISVRYTPTYSGLKEEIILSSYTGTYTFDFDVEAKGLMLVHYTPESNEINMSDTGKWYFAYPDAPDVPVVALSDILIYDSMGQTAFGSLSCEKTDDGQYIVSVVADKAFLESPDTVYPVTVDPSISVTVGSADSSGATKYIIDTMLSARYPSSNFGSDTTIKVGGYEQGYIGIAFPKMNDSNIAMAMEFGLIKSAEIQLYCSGAGSFTEISAYNYSTYPWDETKITYSNNGVKYTADSSHTGGIRGAYSNQRNSIDITNIVKGWYTSTGSVGSPEQGILLKLGDSYMNGSTSYYYSFSTTENSASTQRPRLSITFSTGALFKIKNKAAAKYLNVYNNSESAANVNIYSNDESVGEAFRLVYDSSTDSYFIYSVCSNCGYGNVVSVVESGTDVRSDKITASGHDPDARCRWKIKRLGNNTFNIISAANSTMYLTASGTANSSNVCVSTASGNGTTSQWWSFELIDDDGCIDISDDMTLYKQATAYTCGPASVRILLAHFGIIFNEEKELYKDIYGSDNYDTNGAILYDLYTTITSFLKKNSINKKYGYTPNDANGPDTDSEKYYQILRSLLDDAPVIVNIAPNGSYEPYPESNSGGHYIVVAGIVYENGVFKYITVDPYYYKPGIYTVDQEMLFSHLHHHRFICTEVPTS